MIKEVIQYKNANGSYKNITYYFKDEAERQSLWDKALADESKRKIIGTL